MKKYATLSVSLQIAILIDLSKVYDWISKDFWIMQREVYGLNNCSLNVLND